MPELIDFFHWLVIDQSVITFELTSQWLKNDLPCYFWLRAWVHIAWWLDLPMFDVLQSIFAHTHLHLVTFPHVPACAVCTNIYETMMKAKLAIQNKHNKQAWSLIFAVRMFSSLKVPENLAVGKITHQSTMHNNESYSSYATDGFIGNNRHGDMSKTQYTTNQWWRVDLQKIYNIRSMLIYSKGYPGWFTNIPG